MATVLDPIRLAFHGLRAEIEAIDAKAAPLREQRDAIHAKAREIELTAAPLDEQIATIERDERLYEKKVQLATLSRALGGKTALDS